MKKHHAIFFTFLLAVALSAQTYQGRILGVVSDQSGAVVPGAKVTITNTATGATRALTTSASGDYAAPNLEPGPYTVTVEASGFQKFERLGLELEVARDIRNQYSIAYHSARASINGYHSVKVEAHASGHGRLTVNTRSGYLSKQPLPGKVQKP